MKIFFCSVKNYFSKVALTSKLSPRIFLDCPHLCLSSSSFVLVLELDILIRLILMKNSIFLYFFLVIYLFFFFLNRIFTRRLFSGWFFSWRIFSSYYKFNIGNLLLLITIPHGVIDKENFSEERNLIIFRSETQKAL